MTVIQIFALFLLGISANVNAISARCGAKCEATYSAKEQLNEPCKRGCRLYSIHDATRSVDPFFASFNLRQIGWNNHEEGTFTKCSNDCSNAYENKEKDFVDACIQGCTNEKEVGREQIGIDDGFNDGFTISFGNPGLFDFNSNIFDDFDRMIARTRSHLPSFINFPGETRKEEAKEKQVVEADHQGTSPFSSMFDSVHQNVQNLMKNVLGRFNQHMTKQSSAKEDLEAKEKTNGEEPTVQGGGKLVVIQDGPGYHQEKTYKFGPNADVGKIFKEKMNDMVDHRNPLENFFRNDDVEMIDPSKLSNQKEENKEENIKEAPVKGNPAFDIQVLGPFVVEAETGDSSEESREDDSILGLNFDDLTGPKLPESGLRSRQLPIFTHQNDVQDNDLRRFNIVVDRNYDNICSQESRQMKWSDWVSCLHTRLGLPRWLMAATVCLGIIFTLWICLVIPANAPKQRVKKAKKSIGTKELEAMENPHLAVIAVQKTYPLDLPPSYEDVTQTKVNLEPVQQKPVVNLNEGNSEEAGELPEKAPLSNESQA